MGNCSCSCSKYRPPFKHHIRRIYNEPIPDEPLPVNDTSRFRGLLDYSVQFKDILPRIGAYLMKQINRDTAAHNTRRIEIGVSGFVALLGKREIPIDSFGASVISAVQLLMDHSSSPELNIQGVMLLRTFVRHTDYKNEWDVHQFYGSLERLCMASGIASDETRLAALQTLEAMLRVDNEDEIDDRLTQFIPVIFDNFTDTNFRRQKMPHSQIEDAARSCFNRLCLRTINKSRSMDEKEEFYERQVSMSRSSSMVLDPDAAPNYHAYKNLLTELLGYLSSRNWENIKFGVNLFLHMRRWHNLYKVAKDIAPSIAKVPAGPSRLEYQDRILMHLEGIFRAKTDPTLDLLRGKGDETYLPHCTREVIRQTMAVIFPLTKNGRNWPKGQDAVLDNFASHTLSTLDSVFGRLVTSDTLLIADELIGEMRTAWQADSYYASEICLTMVESIVRQRKPFPGVVKPDRLIDVIQGVMHFQADEKLQLVSRVLWESVVLQASRIVQYVLTPTSTRNRLDLKKGYLHKALENRATIELEPAFHLPWFEQFRIYIYGCIYYNLRSNLLTNGLAYSLHHLLILVMHTDERMDVKNILPLMTMIQEGTSTDDTSAKTQDLVQTVVLGVLVQVARGFIRSGTRKKDDVLVTNAQKVESQLLAVARKRSQNLANTQLFVHPKSGLLSLAPKDGMGVTPTTDDEEEKVTENPPGPSNICEFFAPIEPLLTPEQLQEWVQGFEETHQRFDARSHDTEGESMAHTALTFKTGFSGLNALNRVPPSPSKRQLMWADAEYSPNQYRLEELESYNDLTDAFANFSRQHQQQIAGLQSAQEQPRETEALLNHPTTEITAPNALNPFSSAQQVPEVRLPQQTSHRGKDYRTLFDRKNSHHPSSNDKRKGYIPLGRLTKNPFGRRAGTKEHPDPLIALPSWNAQSNSALLRDRASAALRCSEVFEKLGLDDLDTEQGLEEFELCRESIEVLRDIQHLREIRDLDEEEFSHRKRGDHLKQGFKANAKKMKDASKRVYKRIEKGVKKKIEKHKDSKGHKSRKKESSGTGKRDSKKTKNAGIHLGTMKSGPIYLEDVTLGQNWNDQASKLRDSAPGSPVADPSYINPGIPTRTLTPPSRRHGFAMALDAVPVTSLAAPPTAGIQLHRDETQTPLHGAGHVWDVPANVSLGLPGLAPRPARRKSVPPLRGPYGRNRIDLHGQ